MEATLTPRQVLEIENLRQSPFCNLLGKIEYEEIAKEIVTYLAANEIDHWDVTLPDLEEFGTPYDFAELYLEHGKLSNVFIDLVTRRDDWSQFEPEVMNRVLGKSPTTQAVTTETILGENGRFPIIQLIRNGFRKLRTMVALVILGAAAIVYAVTCILVFALFCASIITCLVILAVGGIAGTVVAIPGAIILPDGVQSIVEAVQETNE